jgi:hypothetical protein
MQTHSEDDYRLATPAFLQDVRSPDAIDRPPGKRLEVTVIFTDAPGTLAALQMAEDLAPQLDAHIRLLMPYEVPYALPLGRPPVPVEFLEGQIRKVTGKLHLDVSAHVYLCRDKRRALNILLRPHSLVIVGGKRRWWPTAAQKLARSLQASGHHAIFTDLR